LDRDVAIKQLSPQLCHDEQFIGRFKQEAKALAKLSHPNIVHVHDLVEDSDHTWIVMEYVEGEELAKKITPGKAMPFNLAVKLATQMSRAMQYAHDRGVVHRDFKPANVLVTPDNDTKIMDFGLAKFTQSAGLTQVGTVMGSPAYMSPEQAAGKPVDSSTDIYALGVTLYLMFSGVLPFEGDMQSIISQHLTAVPKPPRKHNNAIPAVIERTILKMMAKQPDKRPSSMKEVFTAFQSLQEKRTA
jgi:serine/threonine protein kinase